MSSSSSTFLIIALVAAGARSLVVSLAFAAKSPGPCSLSIDSMPSCLALLGRRPAG